MLRLYLIMRIVITYDQGSGKDARKKMNNRKPSFIAFAMLLSFALLLMSACSSNSGTENAGSPSPSASEAAANPIASEEASFPRTIQAANGAIAIEKKPQKVAVVHWGYADSLLLFDLPSVGLALPFTEKQSVLHSDSYKPYVDRLGELVVVGENTAVNMEALLAYAPDLIIAGNAINKDIVADLEKIAATVVIDETKADVWGDWPSVVTEFGRILGQEETAEKYIADFRAKVREANEKLADVEGSVAFVQVREKEAWFQGTKYLPTYYEGLGLAPPDSADREEGAQLSLESLSALDPDHLFLGYFNYSDRSVPGVADEWKDTAVWKKLKAVQNGRVYEINGELALGYGPIGHSYGVQAVLEALDE